MSLMLHFRIKTLNERNELKFNANARLLYVTFLHGREDKCQHHWHPFQTDLMWNIFDHAGVLDSYQVFVLFCFFKKIYQVFQFKKQHLPTLR